MFIVDTMFLVVQRVASPSIAPSAMPPARHIPAVLSSSVVVGPVLAASVGIVPTGAIGVVVGAVPRVAAGMRLLATRFGLSGGTIGLRDAAI
jgi:hypothetical protein